jgi:hypothetical protein
MKRFNPIVCLIILIKHSEAKIRVEDSILWPIPNPVEIKESDRVTVFKKLNIGLGIQRSCPKFMIRTVKQGLDKY